MLRGVFVTGTDTGVGKTVVSAALLLRYRGECAVRYWKPIQTGIEQDNDTAEVSRLASAQPSDIFDCGIRLPRPVSPHLAARLSGVSIAIEPLVAAAGAQPPACWIVEGAGGALVPINDDQLMVDLLAATGLPAVVVARSALGTINHTLLTVDALRRRGVETAGVVMVGEPNADNRAAIERYGKVAVIGEMPRLRAVDPEVLSAWATTELDVAGRLKRWMVK